MSTLSVFNITDGTTTVGTSYVVNGSAKAWAAHVLNDATSVDTLNVSSITDTGTGDNRMNLTNNMNYANYVVVSMSSEIGNNSNPRIISLYDAPVGSYRVYASTDTGGVSSQGSHTAAFGDLA